MENEAEKGAEKADDMTLTLFLIGHIDNPCEVEVEPGLKENIRAFYMKLAKEQIPKMANPQAIEMLEEKIKQYEQQGNT